MQATGPAIAGQQGNIGALAAAAVPDRMPPPVVAAGADGAITPAVALPATAVWFVQDDGSAALASAQQPGLAQQRSGRCLGPGQVVEDLFGDQVVAVGVADGQRQSQHPADGPPPCGTEAFPFGFRDGRRAQPVVVGEVPVPDAPRVVLGEPPAYREQRKLATDGGRAHVRVVSGFDRRSALTLQPGARTARVARLTPQRAVDRLRPGRCRPGQDQRELAWLPGNRVGDPTGVEGADDLQAEPA